MSVLSQKPISLVYEEENNVIIKYREYGWKRKKKNKDPIPLKPQQQRNPTERLMDTVLKQNKTNSNKTWLNGLCNMKVGVLIMLFCGIVSCAAQDYPRITVVRQPATIGGRVNVECMLGPSSEGCYSMRWVYNGWVIPSGQPGYSMTFKDIFCFGNLVYQANRTSPVKIHCIVELEEDGVFLNHTSNSVSIEIDSSGIRESASNKSKEKQVESTTVWTDDTLEMELEYGSGWNITNVSSQNEIQSNEHVKIFTSIGASFFIGIVLIGTTLLVACRYHINRKQRKVLLQNSRSGHSTKSKEEDKIAFNKEDVSTRRNKSSNAVQSVTDGPTEEMIVNEGPNETTFVRQSHRSRACHRSPIEESTYADVEPTQEMPKSVLKSDICLDSLIATESSDKVCNANASGMLSFGTSNYQDPQSTVRLFNAIAEESTVQTE